MDITKEQLISLIESYGLYMYDYAEAIHTEGDADTAEAKASNSLKYIKEQISKIK